MIILITINRLSYHWEAEVSIKRILYSSESFLLLTVPLKSLGIIE